MNPDHLDRLISEKEAAEFLGYSVRALQNWRCRGGGPGFIRVSARSIRYRRRELIAWAESNRVSIPALNTGPEVIPVSIPAYSADLRPRKKGFAHGG